MKKIIKQLLKTICYMLLFLGTQFIITIIFMLSFMIKLGIELQVADKGINSDVLMEESTNFLMNNNNIILIISGIITLLFLWVFFKIRKKRLVEEAYIKRFDRSKVIPIILSGFSFALFVSTALDLLPIPESILESYSQSTEGIVSGSLIIMLISIVIITPIVEEIVFRGLILSRLKKAMNTTFALIITNFINGCSF